MTEEIERPKHPQEFDLPEPEDDDEDEGKLGKLTRAVFSNNPKINVIQIGDIKVTSAVPLNRCKNAVLDLFRDANIKKYLQLNITKNKFYPIGIG
jgi:hypothetical protein